MVGDDLLVAPVMKPDVTKRLVYLPKGTWYDYWTSKKYEGGTMIYADAPLDIVPMYVRAGAIIPTWPEMNYIGEKPVDPITFLVFPDNKGEASVTLYEDDGISPAYKQSVFRRTNVSVKQSNATIEKPEGSYNPGPRSFSFIIKDVHINKVATVKDSGKTQTVRLN